jgi:hypothetical protein
VNSGWSRICQGIEGRCRSELKREHCDVVFLAKGLRGIGDLLRRLPADQRGSLKSEELAGWRLGFDDSIGEKGEAVTGGKPEAGFCVFGIDNDAALVYRSLATTARTTRIVHSRGSP